MDTPYTTAQLQTAKDYLWEHLEQASRDIMIHISNSNTMADNGLEVTRLSVNRNLIVSISIKVVGKPEYSLDKNK